MIILILSVMVPFMLTQTYERLREDVRFVNLEFGIDGRQLPIFIRNALKRQGIEHVQISMGYLHDSSIPQSFPNTGISMLVVNRSEISPAFPHLLSAVFSISTDPIYWHYMSQINRTFISDPNDKFCNHNIDELLRNFLPCAGKSGVAEMLGSGKLLSGRYLGVIVDWWQDRMTVRIIVEKYIGRINFERVKYKRCGRIQQSSLRNMMMENIGLYEIIVDRLFWTTPQSTSLLEASIQQVGYDVISVNQWYSPQKHIVHRITFPLTTFSSERMIQFRVPLKLPKGFIIDLYDIQVVVDNEPQQFEIVAQGVRGITVKFNLIAEGGMEVKIHFPYRAALNGFQSYKSINGGGEQIMRIPLLILNETNYSLIAPPLVSERLLQPDFSIPFHTITFTIATLGYLWMALWRAYTTQAAIN